MNENIGHNWRSYFDDEYDRLVDLSAMAMIAASRKPELSKQSAFYAKQAIARGGGMIGDGLAVFSDVTDRAAEIYLNELRGRFSTWGEIGTGGTCHRCLASRFRSDGAGISAQALIDCQSAIRWEPLRRRARIH
jgi:hypothetical protein